MNKELELFIEGLIRNYNREDSILIEHAFKAGFYELSDKERSDDHRAYLKIESELADRFLNLGRRYANDLKS